MDNLLYVYIYLIIVFGTCDMIANLVIATYKNNSYFSKKKEWNEGMCPNCGKIYKYENTGPDYNLFSCECLDEKIHMFFFRKYFTNDLVKYYKLQTRHDEYTRKITIKRKGPLTTDMIYTHTQYQKELRDHLNKNNKKKWSRYVYENIFR